MRLAGKILSISWWRAFFLLRKLRNQKITQPELPLRAEIFSAAQMEQHGKFLAAKHKVSTKKAPDQLLARLAENERVIRDSCKLIVNSVKSKMQPVPAGIWLLDNFYLIEEQIRLAKRHLPRDYSRGLPLLQQGPAVGMPRIYEIALEIISHGDARIDQESLGRFISAYQETTPLLLGELWALPIMLRLALIENLRRISDILANDRLSRNLAEMWAEQMIETAEKNPSDLILIVADMARSSLFLDGAFIAEFTRCLQGHPAAMMLPLNWIEQSLGQHFQTSEQVIQSEIQQQSADQISISNSIGSLRLLNTINWRDFVESVSEVEKAFRKDPAGIYAGMDFATRDYYRHRVEELSKQCALAEEEIAHQAIHLAEESAAGDLRTGHVGYYLIHHGKEKLERDIYARLSLRQRLYRWAERKPLCIYLGAAVFVTCIVAGKLTAYAYRHGIRDGLLVWAGVLSFICAFQLAISLVNWLVTQLVKPQLLPRMDYTKGIPALARTLVVVPTLIAKASGIDHLCEALEVRYLANRSENIFFCLLTDFTDAACEELATDTTLLQYAADRISALNKKYASENEDVFFMLHRPRLWNPEEKVWMGYERKRGKLGALNMLLRGEGMNNFSFTAGRIAGLKNIKYVITLDTDTQLPRDAARQFIGSMAHPLNWPVYDADKQRVIDGYSILQPRAVASLPGASASLYAQFCSDDPGIDPYTRAISDVYQDAFGEGSFIGKGIYDVDAYELALKDRLPENRILSHDLLEGCYARAGLLSDAALYEEYPSRYSADVARRHRWVRGDWQIASWILPSVPSPKGKVKNPLSALSRWKIFDNLRRSLLPVVLLLLLLTGWALLPSPWLWTVAAIGVFLVTPLLATAFCLLQKQKDISFRQKLAECLPSLYRSLFRACFELAVLPYEAFYHADAMMRALWRMCISRHGLLEWTPSSDCTRQAGTDIGASYSRMWFPVVLGIAAAGALLFIRPRAFLEAMPVIAAWAASPLIVWRLSRPLVRKESALSAEQIQFLNRLSRRIWAFFETYVGPDDNWLPPDNIQEEPVAVVAHRTSPTNMGLALLANLAAWDFGYITAGRLINNTANTMKTMVSLPRYRGHFYNWYDTRTLKPLHPLYVSFVDSGNLSGHLMTLRQGLLAVIDAPVMSISFFHGLRTTLGLIEEASERDVSLLKEKLDESIPNNLADMLEYLKELTHLVAENTLGGLRVWSTAFAVQCQQAIEDLTDLLSHVAPSSLTTVTGAIPSLRYLADCGETWAIERIGIIEELAQQAEEMSVVEYDFLHEPTTNLLSIGYNVDAQRRDASYYDLLASEARLGYFVAIAQGKLPQESWFMLGRQLTEANGVMTLVSWSGSMFEYLMPLLVMPTFDNTLIDQTYRAAVRRQISYGEQRGVPWGVSESGYNMFDGHLNYQYRAFGVPGMGLKRGLGDDLVIAPYAAIMSLMVDPEESCRNLQYMTAEGFAGRFGLYEAVDYTPSRLPRGKSHAVIQSFMAHHQGMSFLSLNYLLLNRPMQKRFEADPRFAATAQLLHEKAAKLTMIDSAQHEITETGNDNVQPPELPVRVLDTPHTRMPEVQLLSNGRYHVMVSNAGGSYSRWKDLAVTRWREDGTCDNWGTFCYIRDLDDGVFWSTSYQPTLKDPKHYEVIFSESRAEFRRRDKGLETHTEIVVSPEDDIEIRRSRITNRTSRQRVIDVTSYAEVVLASSAADAAHPAFSNLFVQTEILSDRNAILCTRRPRAIQENPPWAFHMMSVHGASVGAASFETDRMQFIGRGHTVMAPKALLERTALSGSEGSVLDPIVAVRRVITLEPEQSVTIDVVTGMAGTRDECLALIHKYQDLPLADRVFEMTWSHGQANLRQMNATDEDAQLYAQLAGAIIYANTSQRGDKTILAKNRRGQSGLWGYAISGDLPVVLLKIRDIAHINLARQLVQAHAYWRLKGLAVDLVIWNEDQAGYRQLLQEQILSLIATGNESQAIDRPCGIFVRALDQISAEDRILIESVARVVIDDRKGTLEEQIRRSGRDKRVEFLIPLRNADTYASWKSSLSLPSNLLSFNGTGGFMPDGKEYAIQTEAGKRTPLPWSNILANPHFGSVISESGQSYTWCENAHEFRLTPWHNDPVTDAGGEAFYIRDEESGAVWSPTALPMTGTGAYITRHGFGYSVFAHEENAISSELRGYVAIDVAVKFWVLKLANLSDESRSLSVTGYVEWVLGDQRAKNGPYIITEIDPATGALIARNHYNTEFTGSSAFFDCDEKDRTYTGDRREFLGRNGNLQNPEALKRLHLSGRTGAGLDACGAIQTAITLEPGEEREIIFRLGMARAGQGNDVSSFIRRQRGQVAAKAALQAVHAYWQQTLGHVQVETPDTGVNLLANGWLLYQTIACRLWARSGYYQSGGAFGFRDQLQDTMALVHAKPALAREQILLSARHQFIEGDVLHWWHPPSDRGVRTKCSDDYLWLPLAVCRYVETTDDFAILEEIIPFIEGRPLAQEEESYYDLPIHSAVEADLYQHCVRAIQHGLRFGVHGLPLIGSCDWNDGMDKVGVHGQGESVWLAFFLYGILQKFADIAEHKGDLVFSQRCRNEAVQLHTNIEANGWDGGWYRRAYFDDGTPLGSSTNEECQIDSLSQSWAVLSGAGSAKRIKQGMDAAEARLVRRHDGLVQLLDPPFDKSALNPGYIRGYVPGVRENGGQYTHAAIWMAMAFAQMGEGQRAWNVFNIINPVNHGRSAEEVAVYKAEPYVVAADVYGVAPHTGRGGWTWYTGSSGWMYQLILESILGLRRKGNKLTFAPCLPADWESFKINYRFNTALYVIEITPHAATPAITLDGVMQASNDITLLDDGGQHRVSVRI